MACALIRDVLYVRTEGVEERLTPADLVVEGGRVRVGVETTVSLRAEGPFDPLVPAIETNGVLRDELAREISIPSLRDYRRIRLALLGAALVPMGMLLELDRELVTAEHASAGRAVIDLILVAFVGFELSRRTPRFPGICATALLAIALRYCLVVARLCAHGAHLLLHADIVLSAGAALVVLVRVPSRARVSRELLGKLGITRSQHFAAMNAHEPPAALVAAAIGCAAGLPAVLHLCRMIGCGLVVQAISFVGFAVVAPFVARRALDPTWQTAPSTRFTTRSPHQILLGVASGLAITAAAVTAARLFFDTGAEVAHCVARLDAEAKLARAAESSELTRAVAMVRASVPLTIMTALVFPFAEERIFRGLLQDVLTKRYGRSYGVFAASFAFGIAHLGVYHVALYQTVLLGLGFGVAYLEGGLIAAFVVHATWNLLQLA